MLCRSDGKCIFLFILHGLCKCHFQQHYLDQYPHRAHSLYSAASEEGVFPPLEIKPKIPPDENESGHSPGV